MYFVYFSIFSNKKGYVGMTCDLNKRFRHHISKRKNKKAFQKAIHKYGVENMQTVVLKCNLTKNEAFYWEKYYIAALNTPILKGCGYNMTFGGEGAIELSKESKLKHKINVTRAMNRPETKRKLSLGKLGKTNPQYNKKWSEETIEKHKLSRKIKRSNMKPVTVNGTITYLSMTYACEDMGIGIKNIGNVHKALTGKLKSSYGHTWKYAKQEII